MRLQRSSKREPTDDELEQALKLKPGELPLLQLGPGLAELVAEEGRELAFARGVAPRRLSVGWRKNAIGARPVANVVSS